MTRGSDAERTVLVVDDNAALVDNLREILEDAGYRVGRRGDRARRPPRARQGFDVALVDLQLPDGDGNGAGAAAKEAAPGWRGRAAHRVRERGVGAGGDASRGLRVPGEAVRHTRAAADGGAGACARCELRAEKRELARRAQRAEKLAAVGTMTAGSVPRDPKPA